MAAARRAENAIIEPEWKWALTADPHFAQYTSVASICFDRHGDVLLSVTRQDASGQVFLASIMRQPRSHPRRMPPQFCHLFGEQFRATDRPSWYTNLVCHPKTGAIYAFDQGAWVVVELHRQYMDEMKVSKPLDEWFGGLLNKYRGCEVELTLFDDCLLLRALAVDAIVWLSLKTLEVYERSSCHATQFTGRHSMNLVSRFQGQLGGVDSHRFSLESDTLQYPKMMHLRVLFPRPHWPSISQQSVCNVNTESFLARTTDPRLQAYQCSNGCLLSVVVPDGHASTVETIWPTDADDITQRELHAENDAHFRVHYDAIVSRSSVPPIRNDKSFGDLLLIPKSPLGHQFTPLQVYTDSTRHSSVIAVVYQVNRPFQVGTQCVALYDIGDLHNAETP